MWDAIKIMQKLRDLSSLDCRIKLFSRFLEAEFKYDGFVYGIGLDTSSVKTLLHTFQMKTDGMSEEWLEQYALEGLAAKDLSVLHVGFREGVMHQSRIFDAADRGEIPDYFAEVPNRVRDYSKSGFFVSLRSRGVMGGVGIHSSIMSPDKHDAQFVKNGHLVVELCRQFHQMACWKHDVISATGISDMNLKVLALRSQGLTAKQVIEITGHDHQNSVVQHIKQARKKLHAANEMQAIIRARSLGLIDVSEPFAPVLSNVETASRVIAEHEGWLGEIT